MWTDPIVEETRKLREDYAAKHGYSIRDIVLDLKQWEQDGFPTAANPSKPLHPTVLPSHSLPQNGG